MRISLAALLLDVSGRNVEIQSVPHAHTHPHVHIHVHSLQQPPCLRLILKLILFDHPHPSYHLPATLPLPHHHRSHAHTRAHTLYAPVPSNRAPSLPLSPNLDLPANIDTTILHTNPLVASYLTTSFSPAPHYTHASPSTFAAAGSCSSAWYYSRK